MPSRVLPHKHVSRRELTARWLEMQTEIVMNSRVCLIVEALADKVTSLIKLEKVHFQGRLLDVKWLRSALEQAEFKVDLTTRYFRTAKTFSTRSVACAIAASHLIDAEHIELY